MSGERQPVGDRGVRSPVVGVVMTSVDRGEHTETATRAGVGQEQRNDIMRHTSMTREQCDRVLDDFAAAVRAEEREQIRADVATMVPPAHTVDQITNTSLYGAAIEMRDLIAARLARGSS